MGRGRSPEERPGENARERVCADHRRRRGEGDPFLVYETGISNVNKDERSEDEDQEGERRSDATFGIPSAQKCDSQSVGGNSYRMRSETRSCCG